MPRRSNPEKIREESFKSVLRTEQGRMVLDYLVRFAQATDVTEARQLGRCDVVNLFMREAHRANEVEEKEEETEE